MIDAPRPSCSVWPTAAPVSRVSPTCCACSGRSPPRRSGSASDGPDAGPWLEELRDADGPSRCRSAAPVGRRRGRRPAPGRAGRAAPPGRGRGLASVDDPLADLLSRYARTHGPFTTAEAARFGLGTAVGRRRPRRLARGGRLTEGEFRPQATGSEWVDRGVLRRFAQPVARRRPQAGRAGRTGGLARFLPVVAGRRRLDAWHRGRARRRRPARGLSFPASRVGEPRAARARGRLLPRDARRAARRRRGRLDRAGTLAGQRRMGAAPLAERELVLPLRATCPTRPARDRSSTRSTAAVRSCSASSPRPSTRPTTRSWWRRCGSSSGRGASRATRSPPARDARRSGGAQIAPRHARARARLRSWPADVASSSVRRAAAQGSAHGVRAMVRLDPSEATPRAQRPAPRRCSTGTASSRAARSWPSRRPGGSPPPIGCSASSSRPVRAARLLRRHPRRRPVRVAATVDRLRHRRRDEPRDRAGARDRSREPVRCGAPLARRRADERPPAGT